MENNKNFASTVCPPQLDSNKYRIFERRRRPAQRRLQSSAPSSDTQAMPEVTAWPTAATRPAWGAQYGAGMVAPAPAWPAMPAYTPADALPESSAHRPPILASVAVTSCAGGSGASTVAANLAAGLALSGHSVMLDDYTSSHAFSYFFGVNPVEQNLVRSFATPAGGALHLVFNAPGTNDQSAAVISALHDQLNWMISDCQLGQIPSDVETVIAVCAPEPRSLMSAVTLKRWLDKQRPLQKFFFLLNQFDPSSTLHCRMRDRLAEQVGQMLLSVTIPKSDQLCEAFFKGKTVLEYAPGAPVCQDFRHLVDWVNASFESDRGCSLH